MAFLYFQKLEARK